MAVKGKTPQPLSIDPAVEAAIGRSPEAVNDPVYGRLNKVGRARNMTQAQRRKAESDAARNRAMFDLPAELEDAIERLAKQHSVPKSQVASYLMLIGLQAVVDGSASPSIEEIRQLSRSMRYEHNLELPEVPRAFRKR